MSRSKAVAPTRRFATDNRAESQLAYLRHACALAISGGRPPSYSTIIRRAIGLYTEHVGTLIEAGRLDGLSGPHDQDASAERRELADYGHIVEAAPPVTFVDVAGKLQPWGDAIRANVHRSLLIPTQGA